MLNTRNVIAAFISSAILLSLSCSDYDDTNSPPRPPYNPCAPDRATDVSRNDNITWQCVDPDGDSLTFDVFLGTSPEPPLVRAGQTEFYFDPGLMAADKTYFWRVVAKDARGATAAGSRWCFTTGESTNNPPGSAVDPYPEYGAVKVSTDVVLSWNCADAENDVLAFDVYFGLDPDPPLVKREYKGLAYDPGKLAPGETYYWRVVAYDGRSRYVVPTVEAGMTERSAAEERKNSASAALGSISPASPGEVVHNLGGTPGPVWRFTTSNERRDSPPNVPLDPKPADGARGVGIDADLSWVCSDPESGPLVFDIYFGKSKSPPLVKSDHDALHYDPGTMKYNKKYYWRVVAKDINGIQTPGPLWQFKTAKKGGNQPPAPPSNPLPADGAMEVSRTPTLAWDCSDPDKNDPLTYDVYFGEASSPPLVARDHPTRSYNVGPLDYNVKYYWQIVARDKHRHETVGPVWSFRAEGAEGAVWVSNCAGSTGIGAVVNLDKTLNIIISVPTTSMANLQYPWAIAIDGNTYDAWVCFRGTRNDSPPGRSGSAKIGSNGTVKAALRWSAGSEPTDIDVDKYGWPFVADYGNNKQRILKLHRLSGLKHGEIKTRWPFSIAVNRAAGTFWASYNNIQMRKYYCAMPMKWTGVYRSGFKYPHYTDVYQATGDVWVCDPFRHRLVKLSDNGSVKLVVAPLYRVVYCAVDQSDGSVWVTCDQRGHGYLKKYSANGTLLVNNTERRYYAVAVNAVDGSVYATRGNTLYKFSRTGDFLYSGVLPFSSTYGVAVEQR